MADRPLRLLQIGKHFPPDRGGIETVTKAISDMLTDQGIVADVLVTDGGRATTSDTLPYRVMRQPAGLRLGNKTLSWRFIWAVRRMQPNYDLALVHLPNPLAVAAMLLFWRKPFAILWHADTPQKIIRRLGAPFERALARRAAAVIGPTYVHLAASHIANALVPKGVVIALPPSPVAPPTPGTATLARIASFIGTRPLILAVGRLVPYKGFGVLIAAAGRMTTDAAVVIVGEGGMAAELQALVLRSGLGDTVMLAGALTDGELAALRSQASIGCMPSVTAAEMYGLAQVEMMALGIPVVATDLPGSGVSHVNVDGETGLIVPPADPDALAVAMERLLTDRALRDRLGRGAKAKFERDHRVDAVADAYVALCRAVAAGESVTPARPA